MRPGYLVYSRTIPNPDRLSPHDRQLGKKYEYFILTRDSEPGKEITGDYLSSARVGYDAGSVHGSWSNAGLIALSGTASLTLDGSLTTAGLGTITGLSGVTARDIGESLIAATYSSRYTSRNYWRDDVSGNSYQVQVQVPPPKMTDATDVALVPLTARANRQQAAAMIGSPSNPTPGRARAEATATMGARASGAM